MQIDIFSTLNIILTCDSTWYDRCKLVIQKSVINIFHAIWHCRNMWRFQANLIPCKTSTNVIISNVSLSGNYANIVASSKHFLFMILESFYVKIHPPNVPKIKEMMWLPPVYLWIKCNIMALLMVVMVPHLVVVYLEITKLIFLVVFLTPYVLSWLLLVAIIFFHLCSSHTPYVFPKIHFAHVI